MPESVSFALVCAVLESVCEKKVMGEALSFLDKEMEGQGGREIKHRGRGSQSEVGLGVDDEAMKEVEVGVKTVIRKNLLREFH